MLQNGGDRYTWPVVTTASMKRTVLHLKASNATNNTESALVRQINLLVDELRKVVPQESPDHEEQKYVGDQCQQTVARPLQQQVQKSNSGKHASCLLQDPSIAKEPQLQPQMIASISCVWYNGSRWKIQ